MNAQENKHLSFDECGAEARAAYHAFMDLLHTDAPRELFEAEVSRYATWTRFLALPHAVP